jgi:hypothetical protein
MFEEIMNEVHRQWLSEFDVEAGRRRGKPRRAQGEWRSRLTLRRRNA